MIYRCKILTQGNMEMADEFASRIEEMVNNIQTLPDIAPADYWLPLCMMTSSSDGRKEVIIQYYLNGQTMYIPELKKVNSAIIDRVGYFDGNLYVGFNGVSGQLWIYYGVPLGVYDALLTADSVGAYFSKHIKKNADYRAEKLWNMQGVWKVLK